VGVVYSGPNGTGVSACYLSLSDPNVAGVPPTKTFDLTKVCTTPGLLTEHFAPAQTQYACFGTRFQWSGLSNSGPTDMVNSGNFNVKRLRFVLWRCREILNEFVFY
jgi:hypothetical protein